jgi:hypothetical protein
MRPRAGTVEHFLVQNFALLQLAVVIHVKAVEFLAHEIHELRLRDLTVLVGVHPVDKFQRVLRNSKLTLWITHGIAFRRVGSDGTAEHGERRYPTKQRNDTGSTKRPIHDKPPTDISKKLRRMKRSAWKISLRQRYSRNKIAGPGVFAHRCWAKTRPKPSGANSPQMLCRLGAALADL